MRYAGFWIRFAASLIDNFISQVLVFIVAFITGLFIALSDPNLDEIFYKQNFSSK